jgi:hypothetical protein
MPWRLREDFEAPSSRRRCFVATSVIRLDVAGCLCLSRLSSALRVYHVDQRAHKSRQSITTSRAQDESPTDDTSKDERKD